MEAPLLLIVASVLLGRSAAFLGGMKPNPIPVRPLSPPGTKHSDTPFPYVGTSMTSALITMQPAEGAKYDGEGKDNVRVDIPGQGPVYWSISRWNQGDLSPRLAPRHPFAQVNLNQPPGDDGFASSDPMDFSTQAWRPDIEKGVMLAAVARNGAQWNDGAPLFFGTVACVTDSRGFGYSMKTGQFGNNNPNLDVTVGKAGQKGEANIDVAVAWFPYEQGWTGGYMDSPSEYSKSVQPKWLTPSSHSPDLPNELDASIVQWSERGARLRLPGVRPYDDGMLFLTSTDPGKWNNDLNVLGAYTRPHGHGWRVQAREDSEEDPTKLVDSSQHMFAFLYVPFSSTGLIGGNVLGADGSVVRGAGAFQVRRLDAGRYAITIGGGPKGPADGVLILQITGRDEAERKYVRQGFLSYNYSDSGALIVEAHKLQYRKAPGGYVEEEFPLVDADFSFMWLDFQHPLTPDRDMFTGRLTTPSSSGPFWVGFLLGLGITAAALAVSCIVLLRLPSPAPHSWGQLFRRPQPPLIPTEAEEEELLRGPYVPARDSETRT